jgi:hypothetical protein
MLSLRKEKDFRRLYIYGLCKHGIERDNVHLSRKPSLVSGHFHHCSLNIRRYKVKFVVYEPAKKVPTQFFYSLTFFLPPTHLFSAIAFITALGQNSQCFRIKFLCLHFFFSSPPTAPKNWIKSFCKPHNPLSMAEGCHSVNSQAKQSWVWPYSIHCCYTFCVPLQWHLLKQHIPHLAHRNVSVNVPGKVHPYLKHP